MNLTHRLRLGAAVTLALVPLSACAVNFDAQTDQQYIPSEGVYDRDGTVDVIHALVVSGTAGSGTVVASLVNNDETRADRLTGVSGAGDDADLTVDVPAGEDEIPAGGALNLATVTEPVAISGDAVKAGGFVRITFSFARGQEATLNVPVVGNTGEYSDITLPKAG